MSRICIIAARRAPQGRFLGTLAKRSSTELGVAAGRAALSGVGPAAIDSVIVGNVLGVGRGMNLARQLGVGLGLPLETPAFTVNAMCASGMQAVLLAVQAIRAGDARSVLCGGTESMSTPPNLLDRARAGYRFGDGVLIDSLLKDGLTDPFGNSHMGLMAERLAQRFGTRARRRTPTPFATNSATAPRTRPGTLLTTSCRWTFSTATSTCGPTRAWRNSAHSRQRSRQMAP